MRYLLVALALSVGLVIPIQAAINNALKADTGGSALLAAFVSFAVGTVALFLVSVAMGQPMRTLSSLPHLPWWKLVGGVLGAFFVFSTIHLAPRLGIAAMLALIITGQIATSLLLDRVGFLGLPVREISVVKLAGAALLVAGVVLVNFGERWFPNP